MHTYRVRCPQLEQILVLKVGTSTLMDANKNCFSLSNLGKFVDTVCDLKDRGFHVVIVSSGAVGSGCIKMNISSPPTFITEKQAISAIGQCKLIRLWEDIFAIRERTVAQLLLTRSDLSDKVRFANIRNTILQLLSMDCIPILNENDALAVEGIKFGDNDALGAYVSISIGASWYFMLTDVNCLYTSNPRHNSSALPIAFVQSMEAVQDIFNSDDNDGTQWGSGGMKTKLIAAKLTCVTGIHTALCHGKYPERILSILSVAERNRSENIDDSYPKYPLSTRLVTELLKLSAGQNYNADDDHPFVTFNSIESMPYMGTIFAAQRCTQSLRDQRRWILSLPVRGKVFVLPKTVSDIVQYKKALYATGITDVQVIGEKPFFPGEAVALYATDKPELELARCVVNFSSSDLKAIKGLNAAEFQHVLGHHCPQEISHRTDIIMVNELRELRGSSSDGSSTAVDDTVEL